MNKELQLIKIAEAYGYTNLQVIRKQAGEGKGEIIGIWGEFPTPTATQPWIPNYTSDLNACHEMEKVLTDYQYDEFYDIICRMYEMVDARTTSATAAQRCEAFLMAMGLWVESDESDSDALKREDSPSKSAACATLKGAGKDAHE